MMSAARFWLSAARVQVLAAAHTATEHAFLSAKLDGVRGTEALVKVLGAGHLPLSEHRSLVKRTWDRLRRRIRAAAHRRRER